MNRSKELTEFEAAQLEKRLNSSLYSFKGSVFKDSKMEMAELSFRTTDPIQDRHQFQLGTYERTVERTIERHTDDSKSKSQLMELHNRLNAKEETLRVVNSSLELQILQNKSLLKENNELEEENRQQLEDIKQLKRQINIYKERELEHDQVKIELENFRLLYEKAQLDARQKALVDSKTISSLQEKNRIETEKHEETRIKLKQFMEQHVEDMKMFEIERLRTENMNRETLEREKRIIQKEEQVRESLLRIKEREEANARKEQELVIRENNLRAREITIAENTIREETAIREETTIRENALEEFEARLKEKDGQIEELKKANQEKEKLLEQLQEDKNQTPTQENEQIVESTSSLVDSLRNQLDLLKKEMNAFTLEGMREKALKEKQLLEEDLINSYEKFRLQEELHRKELLEKEKLLEEAEVLLCSL